MPYKLSKPNTAKFKSLIRYFVKESEKDIIELTKDFSENIFDAHPEMDEKEIEHSIQYLEDAEYCVGAMEIWIPTSKYGDKNVSGWDVFIGQLFAPLDWLLTFEEALEDYPDSPYIVKSTKIRKRIYNVFDKIMELTGLKLEDLGLTDDDLGR